MHCRNVAKCVCVCLKSGIMGNIAIVASDQPDIIESYFNTHLLWLEDTIRCSKMSVKVTISYPEEILCHEQGSWFCRMFMIEHIRIRFCMMVTNGKS